MKTKTMLCALAIVFAALVGFGQALPKGEYIAQPTGEGQDIFVFWLDAEGGNTSGFSLTATFDGSGEVAKVTYSGGSWDAGTRFEYQYPAENANVAFKDLKTWKQFATKVQKSFAVINDETYVDKSPWTVSAKSVALDGLEIPNGLQSLILKRGGRTLAISLDKWFGPIPKVGESVNIGQTKAPAGQSFQYFFPAKLVNREWEMPAEMKTRLAQDQKEIELASKQKK